MEAKITTHTESAAPLLAVRQLCRERQTAAADQCPADYEAVFRNHSGKFPVTCRTHMMGLLLKTAGQHGQATHTGKRAASPRRRFSKKLSKHTRVPLFCPIVLSFPKTDPSLLWHGQTQVIAAKKTLIPKYPIRFLQHLVFIDPHVPPSALSPAHWAGAGCSGVRWRDRRVGWRRKPVIQEKGGTWPREALQAHSGTSATPALPHCHRAKQNSKRGLRQRALTANLNPDLGPKQVQKHSISNIVILTRNCLKILNDNIIQ